MTPYLVQWLADPDGGGRFSRQRDLIAGHPASCTSLIQAWLPRRDGVSCPSDLMECDNCGITFFWEGLRTVFEDCPESHHWLCECCAPATCSCEKTPQPS